ncbi:YceD family protein [Phaeovulum sp. W22_SRMD_FR3]|uniref:YceD family protein n=1 Tax=Phaeovulum sp. W22_SRMD_FR3 TaxID=3240274 RepID=UPI003F997057
MSQDPMLPVDPLPYSQPYRITDLPGRKPTHFNVIPDGHIRAAIAKFLDFPKLKSLSFAGSLTPKGRSDWILEGELRADVVQECIITLEPVPAKLQEKVRRTFLTEMPAVTGDEEEMPEDDTIEQLTGTIDVGAVMIEALELALPLYPRAKGAELGAAQFSEPGTEALNDETIRPFAALGDLLKKKETGND